MKNGEKFNYMNENDTIAAICSGVGSAVTIVRISGKDAAKIGNKVWRSSKNLLDKKNRRKMLFGKFFSEGDKTGEPSLAVYMPEPQSYTGEDIVEIHAHGGAFNAQRLIDYVIKNGARQADAGEFTYRAFINGKLDLTQAEAVADLISANTNMALHLAERQMDGIMGRKINSLRDKLIEILTECESRVDFPEEELDFIPIDKYITDIEYVLAEIKKLYETRTEGSVLREGIRVVIAGRPNAGKSSLLNLLLGYDRAITTDIPGTTRDTLEEIANIRGIPVKLIDTAGVRNAENPIEEIGINRTLSSLKRSQVTIWLLDAAAENFDEELLEMGNRLHGKDNVIVAWNKVDLVNDNRAFPETGLSTVKISVKEKVGVEELLDVFEKKVWDHPHVREPEIAVSVRHAAHLLNTINVLPETIGTILDEDWELASISLKTAITSLGNIVGEEADLDIYESIFSKFCIGK